MSVKKILFIFLFLTLFINLFSVQEGIVSSQSQNSQGKSNYNTFQHNNVQDANKNNSGTLIILILLIVAFIFIIVLMIIQFKLRADLKQIEEIEEKKYRYKSRTLLKSIDELKRELKRLRNVTEEFKELKTSYNQLQRKSSRLDLLKNAIVAIKHPVAITDLNAKIIFCNIEFANLTKVKSNQLLESKLGDIFRIDNNVIPTMSNQESWLNKELFFTLKGDSNETVDLLSKAEFINDAENKPLAIVISFVVLDKTISTQFKQANDSCDQQNDYQELFNNMKDVYFELDANGWIKEISPSIKEIVHLNRQEVLKKKLSYFFTDLENEEVFLKILKQQKEIENFDVSLSDPNGNFTPCSISAKLVEDEHSKEIKIIGSIRNITDRKIDEEKIMKAMRKLKSINKDLMDFAYITSHDLKSPLRAINTLANWIVMDEENKLSQAGKQNMKLLIGRTERMHRLIEAIFEYINIVNFDADKVAIDLNKTLSNIVEKISCPENIKISVQEDLPQIIFERTRIEQIFENLIENAVNYMNKEDGKIKVEFEDKESDWQFSVTDNGPGIEEKYFTKVFQIFQALDNKEDIDGTGIGLAIVKKVIDKYEGNIWLESKPDEGLKVTFTIPKNLKQKQEK